MYFLRGFLLSTSIMIDFHGYAFTVCYNLEKTKLPWTIENSTKLFCINFFISHELCIKSLRALCIELYLYIKEFVGNTKRTVHEQTYHYWCQIYLTKE